MLAHTNKEKLIKLHEHETWLKYAWEYGEPASDEDNSTYDEEKLIKHCYNM